MLQLPIFILASVIQVSYGQKAETTMIRTPKELVIVSSKSSASFSLPYTFGTHEGAASEIVGGMDVASAGSFEVVLSDMKTGNEKMDCHLRESLGLDYTKSDFPSEHVCEDNKIPASGVNSIVYPKIRFEAVEIKVENSDSQKMALSYKGSWIIHGEKQTAFYKSVLEKTDEEGLWGSTHEHRLNLKDFNVEVKNFLFISVEDELDLKVRLTWKEKAL